MSWKFIFLLHIIIVMREWLCIRKRWYLYVLGGGFDMRKVYKNPPVKEVVCEFRFKKINRWDATIPGTIYAKLENDYPKKVQGKELEIGFSQDSIEHTMKVSDRVKFTNEKEDVLIQIGPYHLIINLLTKYTAWEDYLKEINRIFNIFTSALGSEEIERIKLNYINEIQLPDPSNGSQNIVELDSLFDFYPFLGESFSSNYNSFMLGVQFPARETDILQIQMESGGPSVMLDINYFMNDTKHAKELNVDEWLNNAHDSIIESFESCIKDGLRERFQEVK